MDFFFWIDLHNSLGINKIMTIIGPLLNVGQPNILYIIKMIYLKPNIFSFYDYSIYVTILNLLYFIYLIVNYLRFISNNSLITSTKYGHLHWQWLSYFNPIFYLILLAINIFYLSNRKYAFILFSITYFFLFLSNIFFSKSIGEIWCFFGSMIPLIMLIITFFI